MLVACLPLGRSTAACQLPAAPLQAAIPSILLLSALMEVVGSLLVLMNVQFGADLLVSSSSSSSSRRHPWPAAVPLRPTITTTPQCIPYTVAGL